jgi:hypothetical protein
MDDIIRKRHPIRGLFGGLLFGLGLALALISFAVIALGTLTPWVVVGLCTVFGVLLGLVMPARRKSAPAAAASS